MRTDVFTLTTPVAFLVFNRPDTTEQIFSKIREARPSRLFLVADGPRDNRPDDKARCAAVRNIIDQVDWPCEVSKNYSDKNLGCKIRISSGIDWVFSCVEEAIILEDDCLPDSTFFRFCQEMLDHYRHDEKVMMISGTNLLGKWNTISQSYHFSSSGSIWGWASWRRAWRCYDVNMSRWTDPAIRLKVRNNLGDGYIFRSKEIEFDRVSAGKVDTWDYQWSFAQLVHSGLSVVPAVNLISNVGFNSNATHTVNSRTLFAGLPTMPCRFPLVINQQITVDRIYDAAVHKLAQSERPVLLKLADFVRGKLKLLLFAIF